MWRADTPIDLSSLAARTPAPGGGTGAAWGCALGAALAAMAARFAAREEDAARAEALRARALALGEADQESWRPVLEAQRRPADDPDREAAVAAAPGRAGGRGPAGGGRPRRGPPGRDRPRGRAGRPAPRPRPGRRGRGDVVAT